MCVRVSCVARAGDEQARSSAAVQEKVGAHHTPQEARLRPFPHNAAEERHSASRRWPQSRSTTVTTKRRASQERHERRQGAAQAWGVGRVTYRVGDADALKSLLCAAARGGGKLLLERSHHLSCCGLGLHGRRRSSGPSSSTTRGGYSNDVARGEVRHGAVPDRE